MQSSVDATIAGLRGAVSAKTDAELARMLGVDQSTISAWRARGRVPERFVKMVDGAAKAPSSEAPQVWGELQERAQTIALVRFTLIRREVVFSGNVDKALGLFLDLKPYWLILNRAVHELRLKMEASRVDLKTAQALLMQEDLRDPVLTTGRVEQQLAEDIADNPWLEGYK